jgi:exocyst complex component 5
MFDRMVNQISNATTTAATAGTNTPSAQAAAALLRFGVINPDRNSDKSTEEPVREEDGILNIEVVERMLKWHAEAIGRCVELSPSNDV